MTMNLQNNHYSAFDAIEWWDQRRIKQARVLVAGAGALGNEVLKNLALLGLGNILVVDFDLVEQSNLTRSILFRAGDETQAKSVLAAARVRTLNSDISIESLQGDVVWDLGLGRLRRFDIVLGCLDSREARLGLNRQCWKAGIPWIDGALGVMAGQVRIYMPPTSPCYECSFTERDYQDLHLRYSCQLLLEMGLQTGRIPTTPQAASILAGIQVQEMLKLLHGLPTLIGHEIDYDGAHHIYRTIQLRRRNDCLSHDTFDSARIIQLTEAKAELTTGLELLQRAQHDLGQDAYLELDRDVITKLVCPKGHGTDDTLQPFHRTSVQKALCPICHIERVVHTANRIDKDEQLARVPLLALGIPPAHIIVAKCRQERLYYELAGDLSANEMLLDRKEKIYE